MKRTKQDIANRILKYLETNHSSMVETLKKMVVIESPSQNIKAQNEMFIFINEQLDSLGYNVIRVEGKNTGGYLYASPKNRDKNRQIQLLLGHCDTVWDINTIEELPIIQLEHKLMGPGVFDMKAGITQIIYSLKTIKDLKLPINVVPVILINSDEEIGSKESTHIIRRLSKIASRTYVMEPPLGIEGKLKTARKGIGRFTIKVKGKAAHAGLDPEKGLNAIVELSNLVQQLFAMNDYEKGITVNVGMIEGGNSANVIAPESKAVIDVRVSNQNDGDRITNKIHQLKPMFKDVQLSIEGGIGRPPMIRTKRNQYLWKIAKRNGQLIGLNLKQATAGGGSDGNTTSLYTATLDGLGTTGDGAHAKHEFIFTDKLIERTALLTLLLLEDESKDPNEL